MEWERITIPSIPKARSIVESRLMQLLEREMYTERHIFSIKLALEEAVVNAIRHGNGLDPEKVVTVRFKVNRDKTVIEVEDQGCGFDPNDVPDPTAEENLDQPSGRGLMLMNAYMDKVEFENPGNVVRMTKYRRDAGAEDE